MPMLPYFLGSYRIPLDALTCPYLFVDKLFHLLGHVFTDALGDLLGSPQDSVALLAYLIRAYGGNKDSVRFERAVNTGLTLARSGRRLRRRHRLYLFVECAERDYGRAIVGLY